MIDILTGQHALPLTAAANSTYRLTELKDVPSFCAVPLRIHWTAL